MCPEPVLHVHPTQFRNKGHARPSDPGGMAAIYRSLVADQDRTQQILTDVLEALGRGRHCVVLTQWTDHVQRIADALRAENLGPGCPDRRNRRPRPQTVLDKLVATPETSPASSRGTGSLHRRRLRLPSPGHAVPGRADRLQRPAGAICRTRPTPSPG